jgi:flavin-dependent dehydrogenase
LKVAIIGAGLAGIACALELEKKGIIADVFEKDNNVGWAWAEVSFWPNILYQSIGDQRDYLKKKFDVDIRPITECRTNIIKSPNRQMIIKGNLGYFIPRGKGNESLENQLILQLRKASIQYNTPTDYKELIKKYDWVVIATGRDAEARELNVWEDLGTVRIAQGVAIGNFDPDSGSMYMNTAYAGTGFARLTPFNSVQAILSLYAIGMDGYPIEDLFNRFLQTEGLGGLEVLYTMILPPYYSGRVNKFQIGNILLAGRSAGLAESLIGTGSVEALSSGVLAARAIADNEDYETTMKTLQEHIDNVSSFRKVINRFDNNDFDKMVSLLNTPGIKQLLYNTGMNFIDIAGNIMQHFQNK